MQMLVFTFLRPFENFGPCAKVQLVQVLASLMTHSNFSLILANQTSDNKEREMKWPPIYKLDMSDVKKWKHTWWQQKREHP